MADQTAEVVATKEVKFKEDLIAASKEFKPQFTADAATGTITLPAGAVFKSAAAERFNVTEESYANHRQFEDLLNNSLTLAGTEQSVDLFKENKELQTVTMKAPIWKNDAYEGVFNRRGTSRNPGDGTVTNYVGAVGVGRINVVSTRTKAEAQAIKQNFRNIAEAAGLGD